MLRSTHQLAKAQRRKVFRTVHVTPEVLAGGSVLQSRSSFKAAVAHKNTDFQCFRRVLANVTTDLTLACGHIVGVSQLQSYACVTFLGALAPLT